MRLNLPSDGAGSEQGSTSDDGRFVVSLRKMMEKEIQVTMSRALPQMITPILEGLVRKVVKEEIAPLEKFLTGGDRANRIAEAVSNKRILRLKFLDEVSDNVLTGKDIQGKGGTPMRVVLIDEVSKQVINSGPESSAKVEILLLEASESDNERTWSHQEFNSRIIKESDKTKPQFAKSCYIYLEEGKGELSHAKLAHDSNWTRNCMCRLGARVLGNLNGVKVLEAWTEPFVISDKRGKLYGKHYPPFLTDKIWRLVNIGKDGKRCKRLNKINVSTVQDFRFLLSVDPQRLKENVRANANDWEAIVDHAQTCKITDKMIRVYMNAVFDVVGRLKGVIRDNEYVLIDHMLEAEKKLARESLLSALENPEGITFHNDERALISHLSYQVSHAARDTSIQEDFPGHDLTVSEYINHYPTEPGTSAQTHTENDTSHLDSHGLITIEQLRSSSLSDPILSPTFVFDDNLYSSFVILGGNENLRTQCYPESHEFSEMLMEEYRSESHQQSKAGRVRLVWTKAAMLWMFRARERMAMGQRDMHISKKRRI